MGDGDGNTPLMIAAASGNSQIITSWLHQHMKAPHSGIIQQTVRNFVGENLLMIVIQNMEDYVIKNFIDNVDLVECMDQVDNDGDNALLIAANLGKWNVLNWLLTSDKLEDIVFDVHPVGKGGRSVLVLTLMERARLARKEQTLRIKCEKDLEKKVHEENEALWDIVKWLLYKEKELHGDKELADQCLQKQMEQEKGIRPPVPDEVIQESSDLYKSKSKPKKKSIFVEPLKIQDQKQSKVSPMQQKMNDIYKNGTKKEEANKSEKMFSSPNNGPDKNSLQILPSEEKIESPPAKKSALDACIDKYSKNVRNVGDVKKEIGKEEQITNGNQVNSHLSIEVNNSVVNDDDDLQQRMNEEVLWAIQEKQRMKEEANPLIESNKAESKIEIEVEEPNIDDIRAQWKKNRKKDEEVKKLDDFNPKSFMEEIAERAAEKAKLSTSSKERPPDRDFEDRMNEELMWVQREQERRKEEEENIMQEKDDTKRKVDGDKEEDGLTRFLKKSGLDVKTYINEEPSKIQTSMDAIFQNIEFKLQEKAKRKAEEIKISDEDHLAERMNEEIVWALQQKQMLKNENQEIKDYESLKNGTKPKKDLEREEEQKMKVQKELKEDQKRKEKDRLEKARKKEERLEKLKLIVQVKLEKEKEIANREKKQKEDDELKKIMDEEIHWALQEKRRIEQERLDQELKEMERKEMEAKDRVEHEAMMKRVQEREEKAEKEKERLKNAKMEKERIEKLEWEIKHKKEKDEREYLILRKKEHIEKKTLENEKKEAEASKLPKWKKDKLEREKLDKKKQTEIFENERKKQEEDDLKMAMNEEIQWALQEKKQINAEYKEKEKKDKQTTEKNNFENEKSYNMQGENEILHSQHLEKQNIYIEESNIPTWKKNMLSRRKSETEKNEKEKERKEAEELENRIKEELKWAEEAKYQQQKEIEAEEIRLEEEKQR